ncbi:MAG: peptide ABC transporter substrate-binding protein [Gammaproteobacteria bacterium RIFCSPHIGHO2_12_FULL_45_9]|nr:MAG: peptide ABC transporter substrate-binding protein [Gammaproteobacteria bacterium RIFCSPHIGHO2_12_FULL_45_9]
MVQSARFLLALLCISLTTEAASPFLWDSPYTPSDSGNVVFSAFSNPPKTLDPARSYSVDETQFIAQIYDPPLQYHYLKRPYTLEPLTLTEMPQITYLDSHKHPINMRNPQNIAYTRYTLTLKPGMYYEPHPALAKTTAGEYRYLHLSPTTLRTIHTLRDFKEQGTREVRADDYVYEIKRLASPITGSPIFGVMSQYIVGFSDFPQTIFKSAAYHRNHHYVDLRQFPLEGAKTLNRYQFQITIKGLYPPFTYWLAMPFFAPIPWEVDAFYNQPYLNEKNISLSWYPVGSGPFRMIENNPNARIVLARNPNFHGESYPTEGMPEDRQAGYLQLAGQPLPLIDRAIFSLEKESLPYWIKFLQGFYDRSGIASETFSQAIHITPDGTPLLTHSLQQKKIRLQTSSSPAISYVGFNWLDPVIGGSSERARKLRQAISIAINYEEYIGIFMNGRGIPAQGPLPPGIEGADFQRCNPVVYHCQGNIIQRKSIAEAKQLMQAAGYPDGIDLATHQRLMLTYDAAVSGSPDDQAMLDWYRKQFRKIGIILNVRPMLYNAFQDDVRAGKAQIFSFGWMADYPDPENFLFLLYGPNGTVKYDGENFANYQNKQVDTLFSYIKITPPSPARNQAIRKILAILQKDSPWVWGIYPINFVLSQSWVYPIKPNAIANNTLKYIKIDVPSRTQYQLAWNHAKQWPLWLLIGIIGVTTGLLWYFYQSRQNKPSTRRKK